VVKFGLLGKRSSLEQGDYGPAATSYMKYAEMFPKEDEAALASYMAGRCEEKTTNRTMHLRPGTCSQSLPEVHIRHPGVGAFRGARRSPGRPNQSQSIMRVGQRGESKTVELLSCRSA